MANIKLSAKSKITAATGISSNGYLSGVTSVGGVVNYLITAFFDKIVSLFGETTTGESSTSVFLLGIDTGDDVPAHKYTLANIFSYITALFNGKSQGTIASDTKFFGADNGVEKTYTIDSINAALGYPTKEDIYIQFFPDDTEVVATDLTNRYSCLLGDRFTQQKKLISCNVRTEDVTNTAAGTFDIIVNNATNGDEVTTISASVTHAKSWEIISVPSSTKYFDDGDDIQVSIGNVAGETVNGLSITLCFDKV